ncbi:MAG: hypothetical protein ABWK53_01770 [Anaerolineales bacterium]
MWEILLSLPVLGLALMLQLAMVGRVNLLFGSADLPMLILIAWGLQERVRWAWVWGLLGGLLVGYVSGLAWYVPLLGYLGAVGLAQSLRRRIWQAPFLAMFLVTLTSTLWMHGLSFISLRLAGNPLLLGDSFDLITLPSVFLNLALGVLIYPLIRDLAAWLYPSEVEA